MSGPRLARALVAATVPGGPARDGLLGDLAELYAERVAAVGRLRADLWYWREALSAAGRYTARRAVRRVPGPAERRAPMLEALSSDVGRAVRTLLREPAFLVVTVATLALGIGANTAVFSVLDAVLLRPLPYPDADRLVRLYTSHRGNPEERNYLSGLDLLRLRESMPEFTGIGMLYTYRETGADLTGDGPPQRIRVLRVSADYFDTYAATPLLGRTFVREEERAESSLIILSYALWRAETGEDPSVIGGTIRLDGVARTVIGVMRPEFRDVVAGDVQAWLPLDMQEGGANTAQNMYLTAVARLAPGVDAGRAQAAVDVVGARWEAAYGDPYKDRMIRLEPLAKDLTGDARATLWILMGAAGLVLLIACVNVANIFLARSLAQTRDFAVRSALGASRVRLVRHQLIESGLVAFVGGLLGTAVAFLGVRGLLAVSTESLPRGDGIGFDTTLLVFALAITALTVFLFGLLPSWNAARTNPNAVLRDGTRGNTGGRAGRRVRDGVVIVQVALALVLLVGAGVLLRSFSSLTHVDLGFVPDGVATFEINLPGARYADAEQRVRFHDAFLAGLRALPGVESVGATSWLPGNGGYHHWGLTYRALNGEVEWKGGEVRVIAGAPFDALGIELVEGRPFAAGDGADAPAVAVISRSLARSVWGERSPLGEEFMTGGLGPFHVVGMVDDVARDARGDRIGTMYLSHAQVAHDRNWPLSYVVRTRTPDGIAAAAREALADVDPQLVLHRSRTLDAVLGGHRARERFAFLLMSVFAGVAVLLAAIGVHGVLSHAVHQRAQELGIRMALGAGVRSVRGIVVRHALVLTGVGSLLGLAAAVALSRFLRSVVFDVSPTDPVVYAVVPVLLAVVTFAAAWVPARRATRADPLSTLRRG